MAYDHSHSSQHGDEPPDALRLRDVERDLLTRHTPTVDGSRALDVGCGTGELAAYLHQVGYEVDAVDFSQNALARARKEREPGVTMQVNCRYPAVNLRDVVVLTPSDGDRMR